MKQETRRSEVRLNGDMEARIVVPGWSPKGAVEGVCGGAEDTPWMQSGCCRDAMWTLWGTVGAGGVSCSEPPRRECYISDAVEDSRGEGCSRK